MIAEGKTLLRKLGQETIYSSKGHFKSSDIRRWETRVILMVCTAINVLSLIGINVCADKVLAGIGVFLTTILLIWHEGEGKEYSSQHKRFGEAYLALHKELRQTFFLEEINTEKIKTLSESVSKLDQVKKPDISALGRWQAKRAIEKKDPETDNWFL